MQRMRTMMTSLSDWEPGTPAVLAIVVNAGLIVVALLLMTPGYASTDDVLMMRIVSGMETGEPSSYLIYTNVLIGSLLRLAYETTHEMGRSYNCYTIYLYATHFLASTALLTAFLRVRPSFLSMFLFLCIYLGFEVYGLVELQFTTTAAFAAVAGVLLILSAPSSSGWSFYATAICGALLVTWGSLIRDDACYLALLLLAPLSLFELIRTRSRFVAAALLSAAVLSVAGDRYDRWRYENHEDWRSYAVFLQTMAPLYNYPLIKLNDESDKVFEEIGWSENDIVIFLRGVYTDVDHYSTEKLGRVLAYFRSQGSTREDWTEYLAKLARAHMGWILLTISLSAFAVAAGVGRRLSLLGLFVLTTAIVGVITVRFALVAKLPEHVAWSAFLALSAAAAYATGITAIPHGSPSVWRIGLPGRPLDVRFAFSVRLPRRATAGGRMSRLLDGVRRGPIYWRPVLVTLLGVAIFAIPVRNLSKTIDAGVANERLQSIAERLLKQIRRDYINPNPDAIFVVIPKAFPYMGYPPLSDCREFGEIRTINLGWSTRTPYYTALLKQFAVEDVCEELIQRRDLYLLSGEGDQCIFSAYALQHYGGPVQLQDNHTYRHHQLVEGRSHSIDFAVCDPAPATRLSEADAWSDVSELEPCLICSEAMPCQHMTHGRISACSRIEEGCFARIEHPVTGQPMYLHHPTCPPPGALGTGIEIIEQSRDLGSR